MNPDNPSPPPKAAEYLRMSTDRQDFSIEFQAAANREYARVHGYEVVRTYRDLGISGLGIEGRGGLKSLLADVVGGNAPFSVVLTYDVSRWGRFQDTDESAHYEFICRSAGARVEYVAEPFANDGSATAAIFKTVKRAMAAEFSRELSSKVKWGQEKVSAAGYWTGGPASYGYRRQLVKRNGDLGVQMEAGERKVLSGYRTRLVPGPAEEVETVRTIFRLFVHEELTYSEIARVLNSRAIGVGRSAPWTRRCVARILVNPVYAGDSVRGKRVYQLGQKLPRRVPARSWRVQRDSHEALVSRKLYDAAARRVERPTHKDWTEEQMLDALRALMAVRGRLSASLIDLAGNLPCASVYQARFGGLIEAYRRIGYEPAPNLLTLAARARNLVSRRRPLPDSVTLISELRALLDRRGRLSQNILIEEYGRSRADAIKNRLGGYARIYRLVGYEPDPRQRAATSPRPSRIWSGACSCEMIFGATPPFGRPS